MLCSGCCRPDRGLLLLLVSILLWHCLCAQVQKQTRWPLIPGKHLLLVWNAPTEECRPRHQVNFDMELFNIVASPSEGFVRQNLTIFYKERLGLYPYYENSGAVVNGGLPQVASLTEHLSKIKEGVERYIREPGAYGLAVIDWEEWRPQWIRNWDAKDVYRVKSRELVSQKNPLWTQDRVAKVAEQEFELSARRFMLETLRQAKSLRPNQLWGYYLFPDCYNHNYRNQQSLYTGRCPDVEMARNDQLTWLWTESTALYPSIYMPAILRSQPEGRRFVRNRVQEGMRLASSGEGVARPVFVYTRPTYANELSLLTEEDLISTIGESVALGAAGVIFWGDAAYASSSASCSSLKSYLQGPLGWYLLNVSSAAHFCSQDLCRSRGRCLRRIPDSDTYLHLSPQSFSLVSEGGRLRVRGQLGAPERELFRQHFQCQCYTGYVSESCSQKEQRSHGVTPCVAGTSLVWLLFTLFLLAPLH